MDGGREGGRSQSGWVDGMLGWHGMGWMGGWILGTAGVLGVGAK